MSDSIEKRPLGPPMLCATSVIKPGPLRIGRLAGDLTLPRTVPLANLLLGAGGFMFGLVIGGGLFGLRGAMYFGVLSGAGAILAASYSPLKGESLLTWLGLKALRLNANQTVRDGVRMRVAVGLCPVPSLPSGQCSIHFGAASINPELYDDRGTLLPRQVSSPPAHPPVPGPTLPA
jgi:hypothetical protein